MPKRQQVLALLALKWSFRKIERETGVRRETISAYSRQADPNPAKTFPGSASAESLISRALEGVDSSNPAKTFAGSGSNPAKTFPGSEVGPRFAAAAHRDAITEKLELGLTIQRIFQDLVEDYSYGCSYESVKRYVRTLQPKRRACGVMHSLPGEDYVQSGVMLSTPRAACAGAISLRPARSRLHIIRASATGSVASRKARVEEQGMYVDQLAFRQVQTDLSGVAASHPD